MYFKDLTPYAYSGGSKNALNIGWLSASHPYSQGKAPPEFIEKLSALCKNPIYRHRGVHVCGFCEKNSCDESKRSATGNGQIRVLGANNIWYAAPVMIDHYVTEHQYLPPEEFIASVLNPKEVGKEEYE